MNMDELYTFLADNYVEDTEQMFRFHYSKILLEWALRPPGWKVEWHVGIRKSVTNELVGFIAAVPATISVQQLVEPMVCINFLCVHKSLRNLRLTPVLIREITRRTQSNGIQRAVYTAGTDLKTFMITSSQYWHRFLNPNKLITAGFMNSHINADQAEIVYSVPKVRSLARLRPLHTKDVPPLTVLLNDDLRERVIHPIFTEEDVEHYFMPRLDVVESYVIEASDGHITDFMSFYRLDSKILGNTSYDSLKAAFMYHSVNTQTSFKKMLLDILIILKNKNYDVFNMLDVSADPSYLDDLNFRPGSGQLRYYMHNSSMPLSLEPSEVGVILV